MITPAASGEGIGKLSPWLFRNALTNASQAAAAAQYALEQKVVKYVVLYPDDAYGKDLARLFTRELDRKAENLAAVAYPPDVKDFGPYIRKVIEIDLRSRKIPIPEDDAERKKLFQEYIAELRYALSAGIRRAGRAPDSPAGVLQYLRHYPHRLEQLAFPGPD